MNIEIINVDAPASMEPLTCKRGYKDLCVAGESLEKAIVDKIEACAFKTIQPNDIRISINFWPSDQLLERVLLNPICVVDESGNVLLEAGNHQECEKTLPDEQSFIIQYPWDILAVNEDLLQNLNQDIINGTVMDGVQIDGHLILGENSVLLPGVYIEGHVTIGKNCKVGPNCYIRANTCIMDNCHIGQAVEIKNSILMDHVGAGHLTYLGDSIICPYVNFGAGTITANFRHDGKNHRSMVGDVLVDTGRRKFGSIIGDNVHTGIHTSIYPGRKIWPDLMTRPGDIVQKDLKN